IIVESVYAEFEKLFVEKMKKVKMDDPLNKENLLGPQASVSLRNELHQQVLNSIERGANLLIGGELPKMKGAFYPATVLSGVKKGMPAYDEELFGPVAALIKVKNEKEAIETANDSIFGLGAAIFSRDVSKAEEIAKKKLNAGSCFINSFVKSDPRLPFGGVKQSGYGRELSVFGIREFLNIKTVYVK
ncbi:MAG: aldehyde dehydrogenase family protein, partial [Ignavibacteriaceae bacterium]